MAKEGDKRKHYSDEEKQAIIAEYHAGRSPKQIIEEYGLSERTFFNWINKTRDKPKDGSKKKKKGSNPPPAPARIEGDCHIVTAKLPSGTAIYPNDVNYIEIYATQYDFDKMKLQAAAINGYCQGIRITDDMLTEAMKCEGLDKVYAVLACLKERRAIQDRIVRVFSEVSGSSDEYERIFGRLFGIRKDGDE